MLGEQSRGLQGRRVLVTGADGFLGSHLTERLLQEGAVVAVLVRPRSVTGTATVSLRNLAPVREQLDAVLATDVAGPDARDRIEAWGPDTILHLAADAYVERSFSHPREVLRTNLDGTLTVLEVGRRNPEVRVVVTSSSEVYGPAQTERIDEGHPLEPTSPYAASKVAADRMAMAYHRTYGTKVAVIRPFNTYGPRHVYDVIPKFIDRALQGEPLQVFGSGEQSRDFTFVDDMVEAFVRMAVDDAALGRVIHFGSGRATSIAELARMIVELSGSTSAVVHAPARAAEVSRLCADATLGRTLLGWQPRVELAQGLRDNIGWVREHRE